jgi:NADP-dependent 3-hydroxy acid dehydrogenase YdfG/Tfp pilus assembly protein PilF
MSINPIGLAYCVDNEDIARDIQSLLGNYARFQTLVAGGDNGNLPLAEQIRQFGGPCILLVSDNFLRSAACMYGGLSLVQDMQYRLLPVVVDGKKDGRAISTSFERVTDIIQYINYWQDQYLDLRRQRHELSGLDEDTFNEHLRLVREISSEAGEFLRHLRSLDHYSFAQFAANDYYAFFSFIDDEPAWTAFKSRTMAGGIAGVIADSGEEESEEDFVLGTLTDIDDGDEDAGGDSVNEATGIDILPNVGEGGEWGNLEEEEEEEEEYDDEDSQTVTEPQGSPAEPSEEDNTVEPEEEDELDIPIMLEKAWGLASKGDLEAGLNLLDMLLEEYPQDSEIRYHLAMMLADKNDVPAAVRELRKIVDSEEMHEDALSLLVDLYMETGDYDNARNTLTQLLQLNTQHEAGWLSLGELILRQDPEDVESARYAFDRVLKLNPRNERALWFHASVCARMDSHLTEALQSLDYLLSIVPDHAEALSLRQKLHEQKAEREREQVAREQAARENATAQLGTDGNPETGQYVNPTENTGGDNEDGGHPATGQGATSGGDEVDTTNPQPLEAPSVEDPENESGTDTHGAGPETGSGTTGESPSAEGENADKGHQTTTNVDTNTPQPTASTPEHNPLQALKENIAQLEALLQAHEEAEKRAKEALAVLQAAVPAKPGTGKTVLISGATSGIGKATAQRFAQEGYRLILTGRRADRLQSLQDQLMQQTGAEVLLLNFDVRDAGAVQAAVDGLPDNWRQIDILINNAGKAKGLDFIFQGQEDHWEEMIDTNIKGLLYLTRAISPGMVARRSGHIINVGSTAGKEVYPKGSVYCATKFAVDALTKGMRMDLYDKGIRVSQVSPAHVEETEFALVRFDGDEERARQVYDNFQPLKAADVAAVILFMASQPSHVNVLDVVVQSSQQASSTMIDRSGRAE